MSSKFTRSVSLVLLIVSESRSTDFGLSGNCSESSFGFDSDSVSNFDEIVETSPLILATGGGGGTGFSGRFGYTVPGDLNKLLALVGGVGFLGGTCGAAGLKGFCSSTDFSSFSSGFIGKYFFSEAIGSGFGAGPLAGGGGFFGFGKSLSSSFI